MRRARRTPGRRARWLAAAAPLLLAQASPDNRDARQVPAPVLVPDVSQRDIEIAYSFTGADLLLFGAILYPGGRVPGARDTPEIAVVVKGPSQSILVREKKQVAGIWINAARLRFRSAPSFYAIASSRPIERLLDERTRAIYELGVDSLQLSPASSAPADVQDRFQRGLVDLQSRAGLYYEAPRAVEVTDGVLYRARLRVPARVPVGRFTAETFLIRDGRVLAAATRAIDVRKSGAERLVTRAASRSSITYGLVVVALSVFLGWFAGWLAGRR